MTRYRYFLLSSVLQFPYSFNVQQYRFFFAPSPRLCPPPYIENPAAVHDSGAQSQSLPLFHLSYRITKCDPNLQLFELSYLVHVHTRARAFEE